uniref:Uncharacterized protein n=1 Tax=Ixodes scapularis TaxID=6945 RepID=A0A4D5S112_IXOSC
MWQKSLLSLASLMLSPDYCIRPHRKSGWLSLQDVQKALLKTEFNIVLCKASLMMFCEYCVCCYHKLKIIFL